MAATGTFVIAGGGLAAAKAAESLRAESFSGQILVIGAEHHLPYERPPLSKGYLLGHEELDKAFTNPAEWYDEYDIDLSLGSSVAVIDPGARKVTTDRGQQIGYDKLLIATGARPRPLALAEESGVQVAYLRTMEDSRRIKSQLESGRRVAVIGGGWIGLEVAAAARSAGCEVAVIETLELPLVRVLGPEVAKVFADLHRSRGVEVRTHATITALTQEADVTVVHLADGHSVHADLVVVGVGVSPNSELADAAGLKTHDGILVDQHLRASHPDVFAAGDVANAFHPRLRRHLRVEHWDNAIHQGLTAGRNMLGADEPYDRLPYFYTDQYDLGMEYVGNVGPEGYEEVLISGDVSELVFTALWLKDGAVLAGMHVNDWDAIDPIRRIVGAGRVDLAALRDPDVPLRETGL
ncbi:MAG TPA: FAD-dependent oxidoreductase [Nocardioidaceae bacterium]|nr:FAD-dependent oxidoreductase [Nocardioidaceae bacterium]